MLRPPEISRDAAVIYDACELARNTIGPAISSGSAARRNRQVLLCFSRSSAAIVARTSGVSVNPGRMDTTRMCFDATSPAKVLVKLTTPALNAP